MESYRNISTADLDPEIDLHLAVAKFSCLCGKRERSQSYRKSELKIFESSSVGTQSQAKRRSAGS